MNIQEYLLCCLGEEASEITKECSKAMRFGIDDDYKDYGTPRSNLCDELNQLLGVVSILEARGILPPDWRSEAAQRAKVFKVSQFMDYSFNCGALDELEK
jgi:hypothetical protein